MNELKTIISSMHRQLRILLKRLVLNNALLARLAGKKFFGLNEIDKKLLQYLDFRGGFFVELGANDGVTQSNTKHLELFKNWKGILVEPSPKKFQECIKNRKKDNYFVQAACVAETFQDSMAKLTYANLMTVTLGGDSDLSDVRAHLTKAKKYLGENESLSEFEAPALSLTSILIESRAPLNIDFLSLDVEGYELEVLKGIDHKTYRFKFICIECRDLSKMGTYLNLNGYTLRDQLSVHDYLFEDTSKNELVS